MVALRAEFDRQFQCKLLVELKLDFHSAPCLGSTPPRPKHVGPSASVGVATHYQDSGSDGAMVESDSGLEICIISLPMGVFHYRRIQPTGRKCNCLTPSDDDLCQWNQATSYPTQKSESAMFSKPKLRPMIQVIRVIGPLQSCENVLLLNLVLRQADRRGSIPLCTNLLCQV